MIRLSATEKSKKSAGRKQRPLPHYSSFFENEGAQLYYDVYGDTSTDAASLILLHGNGENSSIFDEHIAVYAPYYRVITMDTRAHGRSTRGTGELDFNLLASDLFALLNTLHIGMAVILGFSDGANVAINFTLQHQERAVALILVGANLFPEGMRSGTRIAVGTTELVSGIGKGFSKKAKSLNETTALMTNHPKIDPADLARVRVPTLVIAGEKDVIKREHTELIACSLDDARLCIIEGAGHFVMRDKPEVFDHVTLEYLLEDD